MRRAFHDIPVLDISLRKFEKPSGSFKELIRKFCISIGLLQPGDSRDVIIDIIHLFVKAGRVKKFLDIKDVYKYLLGIDKNGCSESNTRRHLKRLKDFGFIEKTSKGFRLREWLSLKELFDEYFKFKIEPTVNRILEYASMIDQLK